VPGARRTANAVRLFSSCGLLSIRDGGAAGGKCARLDEVRGENGKESSNRQVVAFNVMHHAAEASRAAGKRGVGGKLSCKRQRHARCAADGKGGH